MNYSKDPNLKNNEIYGIVKKKTKSINLNFYIHVLHYKRFIRKHACADPEFFFKGGGGREIIAFSRSDPF